MKIIEEQVFDAIKSIKPAQYELCTFRNIDFSKHSLSEYKFIECEFESCDLSIVNVTYTSFQEVNFYECKLLGIQWDTCNEFLFSVHFKNCKLDNSSFYERNLKGSRFVNCSLEGVEFASSNLTEADFSQSNLRNANFDGADLTRADFSTAQQFSIDGNQVKMNKTKFSRDNLEGLVRHLNIDLIN